jgi:hypothetical protein
MELYGSDSAKHTFQVESTSTCENHFPVSQSRQINLDEGFENVLLGVTVNLYRIPFYSFPLRVEVGRQVVHD